MKDAVAIVVCVVALISAATWLMTRGGAVARSTYVVVVRHTKPRGLEIVYASRSIGACKRYEKQHRLLGRALVIMTRAEVDEVNLAAISDQRFWRDVANLTKGTPAEVATLARTAEVMAARLSAVNHRIAEVSQTEPLTKVDGIPLDHEGWK